MPANFESIEEAIKKLPRGTHKKIVFARKIVASAGAEGAGDVVSDSVSVGTPWVFDFGGTGYITKAQIISAANALTPLLTLFLYSAYPTCEMRDNVANTQPVAADVPYLVGQIDFLAMTSKGSGHSYALATPSTYGNLALMFAVPKLYAVLVDNTGATFGVTLLTILLGAEVDDN